MNELEQLTPQERLALSRRALVAQLEGGQRGYEAPAAAHRPRREFSFDPSVWAPVARHVAERWWRRHPVNAAGQLARPVLERYAREEPVKLMGAAAATGALLVLTKPWRLLSVTALVAIILKSSDVADMVTTLMQKNPHPRKDAQ
ncbi:MAG: hypothetical protein EOP82_14980 [Variovorax sp.]|nr:MAG: hypothetical protein EOP82_14980 [Variovorax sp.]